MLKNQPTDNADNEDASIKDVCSGFWCCLCIISAHLLLSFSPIAFSRSVSMSARLLLADLANISTSDNIIIYGHTFKEKSIFIFILFFASRGTIVSFATFYLAGHRLCAQVRPSLPSSPGFESWQSQIFFL